MQKDNNPAISRDIKGHRYPLMNDIHCRMHLLSEEPIKNYKDISKYRLGIIFLMCIYDRR